MSVFEALRWPGNFMAAKYTKGKRRKRAVQPIGVLRRAEKPCCVVVEKILFLFCREIMAFEDFQRGIISAFAVREVRGEQDVIFADEVEE